MKGFYHAEFTGPAWLRTIAPPGLAIGGLGGWWGKEFMGDGTGMNIVMRGGQLRRILQVHLELGASSVDGKPAILIRYPKDSQFPWPRVIDELRSLDETSLLGLTIFEIGPFNKLPLPFLLLWVPNDQNPEVSNGL